MSFNADNLLGFGGLAIGSVATVAMTKEVVGAMRNNQRRMPPRKMKSKPVKSRKSNNRYSIDNLSRLG